jgi:Calx-beta domain-containing protein
MGLRSIAARGVFLVTASLVTATLAAAAPPRPAAPRDATRAAAGSIPFALQWHRSTFGYDIGRQGLAAADLDGDGAAEIVASAAAGYNNEFWYVLTFQGGEYVHTWTSTPYPDGIQGLRVVNADADPGMEIVVASGSHIYVHDGLTRKLEATIVTSAYEIHGLTVADVDSDGALEFVFCDDYTLYVHDAATGALEYSGPGLGGRDLGVGNVDNDPTLEIVVGDGTNPGYVVNGQTHAVEWTNQWGFGHFVRLGDVDGDGRQEVVSGYFSSDIRIFDVERQSLGAAIPVDGVAALHVLDVEGDGPVEIAFADDQWGGIHVYNGQTLQEKWYVPNPFYDVTDFAFGDTDGDGTLELTWGADRVYVADTTTQMEEWHSLDFGGPFRGLSYGDVDADGRSEILHTSFRASNESDDAIYFIHDALTHDLEYRSVSTTGFNWIGMWRIANANVDADPQQEIFVTSGYIYDGILICYDAVTHLEQWQHHFDFDQQIVSLALADVDNDGQVELVAGLESDGIVFVFDAATGTVEWQSPNLTTYFGQLSLMRIGDVDGDGRREIVVADYDGAVYVIDGVTHTIQNLGDHGVTALETPDRDGNGIAELIIGTDLGAVQRLDPFSGAVLETIGNYGAQIDGLAIKDLTGDSVADYTFAVDNEVFVHDGLTNAVLWSSGVIGDEVGAHDSLLIADVDADGVLELMVSLGNAGFRVYEAGPLRLFAGDTSVQESPGGSVAVFTVALSTEPAGPVTVQYGTANGTASAGADYVATSGTLTFPPGTITRTVAVPILDDAVYDPNETFFLNLGGASGATIQDGQGVATIADDEPDIVVSVDDAIVTEGSAGTTAATFLVTLSGTSGLTTSVNFATADGTATAPGDYLAASGTLTFPPGVVSQPVTVQVVGDTAVETDETFVVNLSAPVNAAIGDGQAVGTIIDDDAPSLSKIELRHGSMLVTDLAAQPGPVPDQDFYRLGQEAVASYEVLVDDASGDVVPLALERLAADNATVVQAAAPVGTGTSVSLRWRNTLPIPIVNQHIRVRSGGCTTTCGTDDVYRIRVHETTYAIPRFNNSGTQVTVLLVQNTADHPVGGEVYFWTSTGALLHGEPLALPPKGVLILNTSTVAALLGESGSVTLSNDGGYGDLTGKAVALEPSAGFSFDSAMVARPD